MVLVGTERRPLQWGQPPSTPVLCSARAQRVSTGGGNGGGGGDGLPD